MNVRNQEQPQQHEQEPAQKSSNARPRSKTGAQIGLDSLTETQVLAMAAEILDRRIDRGEFLSDPSMVGRYLQLKLRGREREVFAVLLLDARHRVIRFEELFLGTVDGAEVHPREVAKLALQYNSTALICAHNHPSGNPEPSAADRAVTARLKQALDLVGVRLLDHFIVADGPAVSLAARGWV